MYGVQEFYHLLDVLPHRNVLPVPCGAGSDFRGVTMRRAGHGFFLRPSRHLPAPIPIGISIGYTTVHAQVSVSLPETDLRVIDAAARKAGETRSSFLRRAALAEACRVRRPIDEPASRRAFSRLLRKGPSAALRSRPPRHSGRRPGPSLIDLVVDASVAFKWLIPDSAEDDVPNAKALLVEHMEGRAKTSFRHFSTTRSETSFSSAVPGRASKRRPTH